MSRGWFGDRFKHSLASRGIPTKSNLKESKFDGISNYTHQMLKDGYGYRVGGYGFTTLKDMLYEEAVELGNYHLPIDVAEKVGIERYCGYPIEDYYTKEDLEEGQPYDPLLIDFIVEKVKNEWGDGKVIWLATEDVVENLYVNKWDFGKRDEIEEIKIPKNAKVLSDLGRDGTLFHFPFNKEDINND